MPGFLAEISLKQGKVAKNFNLTFDSGLMVESLEEKHYYIERRTIKKFERDKVFAEDENYIVLTEGVILNSLELMEKYKTSDLKNAIIKMYEQNGETFFKEFRGSFSGLLYDRKTDKWLIYTNHFGDKQIFYLLLKDRLIVASEMTWIVDYMKNNGIPYSLDEIGAYFILTYGYMLEDYTIIRQIKKLMAGTYIKVENGDFNVNRYFVVDNKPDNTQTEEEIIENIDKLFRKAVRLEFEKDREYGFKHIASLSGGLDSRMTVWVAHEMGYTEQLNVTFSQTDYIDEVVAKSIARDLKHDWVFFSLDNGLYLTNIYDMLKINYGNVLYSGAAHVHHAVSKLNFQNFGLYHTGQLGDVILGTYYGSEDPEKPYTPGAGAYSTKLIRSDEVKFLRYEYENEEVFKFYNRGFNGILSGNLPVQKYTEVVSPFLDVDFFTYCLKIPLKYRFDHRIYKKWILKKHPDAAKYVWEKMQGRITDLSIRIRGHSITLKALPRKVIIKLFKKSSLASRWHMNPIDYWYNTNEKLKDFINSFYSANIHFVQNPHVREMCEKLFKEGNSLEKIQVLTVLAAWKFYSPDSEFH
ncbi:MAG: Asparagine synthase [Thermotoga petrophila]|jgi:asparagine synthase (glutamine-hydrolysing)|uniref:asparagine synthase (glutamine-hydrolyzing) n=1 Tax=Thermotoga petrophila TaxID=93929 RepID=A0A101EQD0_9THEM|nr:asparagine synthase-related protein [Thermotoga sp. RQ2]ACB08668.1 asparagine synthase [Thermotoga sp. RQ2]KUK22744.1 MAG: Asparagine synthase [Thermotoga petrophila]HBT26332.1 asparagine synthase [Pseudothermotoga sp.]